MSPKNSTTMTTQFADPVLQSLYEEGKKTADILDLQAQYKSEQAELARRTEILQSWHPYLDALYANLPEEIAPNVVLPIVARTVQEGGPGWHYAPIYITIPRCAMIAAWVVDDAIIGDLYIAYEVCTFNYSELTEAPRYPRRQSTDIQQDQTLTGYFAVALYKARNLYQDREVAYVVQEDSSVDHAPWSWSPPPHPLADALARLEPKLDLLIKSVEDIAAVAVSLDKLLETAAANFTGDQDES